MPFPLNKQDRETILRIYSMPNDLTRDQIKGTFENFLLASAISYLSEDSMHLPFFGEMKITHEDDEVIDGFKQANLKIEIEPSTLIKKIIGGIKDGDIEEISKELRNEISQILQEKINE